jgi:hypothetical protein
LTLDVPCSVSIRLQGLIWSHAAQNYPRCAGLQCCEDCSALNTSSYVISQCVLCVYGLLAGNGQSPLSNSMSARLLLLFLPFHGTCTVVGLCLTCHACMPRIAVGMQVIATDRSLRRSLVLFPSAQCNEPSEKQLLGCSFDSIHDHELTSTRACRTLNNC